MSDPDTLKSNQPVSDVEETLQAGTDPTEADTPAELDPAGSAPADPAANTSATPAAAAQNAAPAAETMTADEQAEAISLLQQEIGRLREQLERQAKQKEGLQAQAVRIAADFENFRKRTQREKEELVSQAKGDTIVELLPVVDNFQRARQQIKPANEGEMAIHNSYQGVYKQLVDTLKKLGVSKMRPVEAEFDPNYHEAMMREPTDRYPEGTVIEELVAGYLLDERVLRHAMVKVAAEPEPMVISEDEDS